MAFINFVAGTQLTEANLDTMFRQTVMTFASTAARDSALSGLLVAGMTTYQTDTNTFTVYSGSAWQTVGPFGGFTSYTPSLTGSGSNPALGTGSAVTGVYIRVGRLITFRANVTFGTGGGGGSGVYRFSIPVAGTSGWDGNAIGTANCNQGGSQRTRFVILSTSGSYVDLRDQDDVAVTNTVPFTWTSGGIFRITGTYEAAS